MKEKFEENPEPSPESGYSPIAHETAERNAAIQREDVEHQRELRDARLAEFLKEAKENPVFGLLTAIDLFPTNLNLLLAKARLRSAEKNLERYEALQVKALEASKELREALEGLAGLEADNSNADKKTEPPETR